MNLHLTGHHLEITPAIRAYVTAKLERITRHFDHVIDVNVILSVDKLRAEDRGQRARARASDIFCESVDADMYAAIDGLVDKLDRQIIKHKEKIGRAPPERRRAPARTRSSAPDGRAAAVARGILAARHESDRHAAAACHTSCSTSTSASKKRVFEQVGLLLENKTGHHAQP